jgi:hypothetical protein
VKRSLGIIAALALLGISTAVLAQAQPAQVDSGTSAPAEPATEPGEDAAADEPVATDDQAVQEISDLSDLVEEDASVEAKADEEFTPGDEISEDYPVPLPSDI